MNRQSVDEALSTIILRDKDGKVVHVGINVKKPNSIKTGKKKPKK